MFYLQQWGDPNQGGQLYEYCRRYRGVEPRLTHPAGTGYYRGLYAFDKLNDEAKNFLEEVFFKKSDDQASVALQRLLKCDVDLDATLKSAWSRFIMTLFYRNPETIQRLREKVATGLPSTLSKLKAAWETARRESDPPTFEEYAAAVPDHDIEQATLMVLQKIMDSARVGQHLNDMTWRVVKFHRLRYPLLTSDRPYVMTNGLNHPEGHLVMPISPDTMFIATKNLETMRQLTYKCGHEKYRMGERLNNIVSRQSHKFIWGTTRSQLNFVASRIGQQLQSTPLA